MGDMAAQKTRASDDADRVDSHAFDTKNFSAMAAGRKVMGTEPRLSCSAVILPGRCRAARADQVPPGATAAHSTALLFMTRLRTRAFRRTVWSQYKPHPPESGRLSIPARGAGRRCSGGGKHHLVGPGSPSSGAGSRCPTRCGVRRTT